jgi:hypothetical protein
MARWSYFFHASQKLLAWRGQRELVASQGIVGKFDPLRGKRVLLITHLSTVAECQMFPFFFHAKKLEQTYGVQFAEVSLEHFERPDFNLEADIVLMQTWFDIAEPRLLALLEKTRVRVKATRVVFLDSFAPADLRLAGTLNDHIDLYVKKHLLHDPSRYELPTRGDTNLMDYYCQLYGIEAEEKSYPLPAGFLDKIVLCPGFISTPAMVPLLVRNKPASLGRSIDLHARCDTVGAPWYSQMRKHATASARAIKDISLRDTGGIGKLRYLTEMARSKVCFSPFGYGEVAWRDCEAVALGAVLVKPDMGHLDLAPQMFIPHETYVPVAWDFSNLETEVRNLLNDKSKLLSIALRAHSEARRYWTDEEFVPQMSRLFV